MGRNKLLIKDFIVKANDVHNHKYEYLNVNYINTKTKVLITCKTHGDFKQTPAMHLRGQGCSICGEGKKGRKKLTTDEFLSKAKNVHQNRYKYVNTIYKGYFEKLLITCEIHGNFTQTPSDHLQGYGCPICKISKGELTIRKYLIDNEIEFIQQHTFIDCIDKARLPFDFYLPKLNSCIEFDGIQHFKPKTLFGGEAGLIDRQKKDNIKTNYCKKNEIHLLRISYNEDILFKLNNTINLLIT
jgi:hypothetical protein